MAKHNLDAMEHDDGVELPPFVTRITMPVSNDDRLREFNVLYPVFAAREMPQYGKAAAA